MNSEINQQIQTSNTIRPLKPYHWIIIFFTAIFSFIVITFTISILFNFGLSNSRVAFEILVFLGSFAFLPWLFVIALIKYNREKAHEIFWKTIASKHNWNYSAWDVVPQRALVFREGFWRSSEHFVKGNIDSRSFRLFEYRSFGSMRVLGLRQKTIAEFSFSGTFPHLYLCSVMNVHMFEYGIRVPLPAFAEQVYTLYSAKEYEMEALQVFTPDILQILSQHDPIYDIELVDQKLLVIRPDLAKNNEQVEEQFALGKEIAKRLNCLDRSKLEPIGTYNPKLKQIS